MVTTMDKAGRVVIPAAVREPAGFEPGMEIDVPVDDFGVRWVRRVLPAELERVRGHWRAQPTAAKAGLRKVDPGAWTGDERDRWP